MPLGRLTLFWGWWLLAGVSLAAAQPVAGRYIVELSEEPVVLVRAKPGEPRRVAGERLQAVRAQQQQVRRRLAAHRARIYGSVERVANALLVEISDEQVERIRSLAGVKRVHPVRWLQASLDRAIALHRVPQGWSNLGGADLAGLGVKIGIIDSGIDNRHPAFIDPALPIPDGFPRVNQSADLEFTSNKVIVARSYLRLLGGGDISARDSDGHGTAVAMAAAGMPVAAPEGVLVGVAPKAYLGSYNVFERGSGRTRQDIVLKAVDDAVADGMDVINLSLGSALAGRPSDELFTAIAERATALGTLLVVAAGNEGPEPFTVSDLSVAPAAISVGATWNDRIFTGTARLSSGELYRAVPGSGPRPAQPLTAPLVDAATLDPTGLVCGALPAGSLSGRIPLILRGTCLFEEKLNNARAAGAVGALVYTDQARPEPITMAVGGATLPAAMVSYDDGVAIKRLLASSSNLTVTIDFRSNPFPVNPNRIAEFSSSGPSTDFGIKPDLVATGTTVRTAAPGGGFQTVQGTSFSAPLVAGAAAVLKAWRPGYPGSHYRSLLINTATPLVLPNGQPAPIRRTGGGVLNLEAAVNATLTAYPTSVSFGTTTAEAVEQLTLFNLATTEMTLMVMVQAYQGGPAPLPSETSVTIGPRQSRTLSLRLAAQGAAPGEYQGNIWILGPQTGAEIHIPWWHAVPSSVPAFLKIVRQAEQGSVGALLRRAISVRVTDPSGVPLREPPPRVSVVSGGGSVVSVDSADSEIPGLFDVSVRLGSQAGNNVFRIEAGALSREVTIVGR